MPFVDQITRFLERFVKDRTPLSQVERGQQQLSLLDAKLYDRPAAALMISRHELSKMGYRCSEMAASLEQYILGNNRESNSESIFRGESELDVALKQVSQYVAELLSQPLAESEIEEVKAQLKMSDEFESISDYLAQIAKHYLRLAATSSHFDESQQEELLDLHAMISEMIDEVSKLDERHQAVAYLPAMESKGKMVTNRVRQLRDAHWSRLSTEKLDPLISTVYGDLLSSYRKVKNHLVNVVEARAGLK